MAADLPSFLRFHDGLKERTEDRRRNARPVEARAGKQGVAHVAVEAGETGRIGKEFAIDVGERGKSFVEVVPPSFGRRVQHVEETREVQTKVGAVFQSAVQQVERERFTLEDARVFGEETEQNANKEAFEMLPRAAAGLQRVAQAAHDFDRFNVDRVLFLELHRLFKARHLAPVHSLEKAIARWRIPFQESGLGEL